MMKENNSARTGADAVERRRQVVDARGGGRGSNVGELALRHDSERVQLADGVVHVRDARFDRGAHARRGHLRHAALPD